MPAQQPDHPTKGKSLDISNELRMTHYKMNKTFEGAIEPEPGAELPRRSALVGGRR